MNDTDREAMFDHDLQVFHRRHPMTQTLGEHASRSDVEIHASSSDLTEAWRELLSRMPSDLYAALKAAMPDQERDT